MVVALSTCVNAASQTRRVAQDSYGSKPDKLTARICFLLCPRERTSRIAVGMSVSCQKQTHALQQAGLFDHLVGSQQYGGSGHRPNSAGAPSGAPQAVAAATARAAPPA